VKTSITFYVPLSLKLRIDHAAALDERSTSQYIVRILEKCVPPAPASIDTQIDLEDAIKAAELRIRGSEEDALEAQGHGPHADPREIAERMRPHVEQARRAAKAAAKPKSKRKPARAK
jgi:hypothetical protein